MELKQLYEAGKISKEEMEAEKAKLMDQPVSEVTVTQTNDVAKVDIITPVPKSGNKNILYGIIIALTIIAIGLGIFAYYKVKESDNNNQLTTPQSHAVEETTNTEDDYQRTSRGNQEEMLNTYSSTPTQSPTNLLMGYVKDEDGYTNVRQGPGTNYAIVTQILDGNPVYYTIVPNSNWYLVYDERGNTLGYMYSNRIVPSNRVQNSNGNNSAPTNKEGYVEVLSSRKLNELDLEGLSNTDLTILRNMIYARHGYRFKRDDLFQYFSQFSWYNPTTSDMEAVSTRLSNIELYNVDFIKKHE